MISFVMLTAYMAGDILSQASFWTMTECVSARNATLQNNANITAICSYQSSNGNLLDYEKTAVFFRSFQKLIKELKEVEKVKSIDQQDE